MNNDVIDLVLLIHLMKLLSNIEFCSIHFNCHRMCIIKFK